MNREKLLLFLLFFVCLVMSGVFSQEVSEKKDISVFNISYYGAKFHSEVIGPLDTTIRRVVVDMGRFRVLEVRKRFFREEDLYEFIERIKEIKEQEVEIPEEVEFGHVIFTEADFNALISSFIVIIPEVSFYDVNKRYNSDNEFIGYDVKLITSYTVLDANTMEVVAKPEIETSGFSKDREEAWLNAAQSVASDLELALKKVPIFTIKTGVIDVRGTQVDIERGKNLGIRKGYEFEIIRTEEMATGFTKERHAGLILVNSVFKEFSEATVLYGKPRVGDQLVEVPRVGIDGLVYLHILSNPPFESISIIPGLKAIWSMGLYFIKPVFGIEIPIADLTTEGSTGYMKVLSFGFPLNFYLGCDINFYMGRLQISPTLVVGGTLVIPWEEDRTAGFTHLGFKGYVSLNYLFHRDMKLTLDLGYSSWFTFLDDFQTYSGILGGLAFVWKT